MKYIRTLFLALSGFGSCVVARACGPWFLPSVFADADRVLLRSPVLLKYGYADLLGAAEEGGHRALPAGETESPEGQTLRIGELEFSEAVSLGGQAKDLEELKRRYLLVRKALLDGGDLGGEAALSQETWDGFPREFALYLQGAWRFRSGDTVGAVERWKALLDLPAEERVYRSTWAAYMIGRGSEAADAAARYRQVRALAKAGFRDGLGLAAASFGWEAQLALKERRWRMAALLYLEQLASGDARAELSLDAVAGAMVKGSDGELDTIVADALLRKVGSLALLRNRRSESGHWLGALERIDAAVREEEASRFALIAYEAGSFETASRWVRLVPGEDALAIWIQAKLKFRSGDAAGGFAGLKEVERLLAGSSNRPVREALNRELSIGSLGEDSYAEALRLAREAGSWIDVAYLAERALTLEELAAAVEMDGEEALFGSELKALLSRRLVREGRYAEALGFVGDSERPALERLADGLRRGGDGGLSSRERAEGFWDAALAMREDGLEVAGYELEPDFAIYGGSFRGELIAERRLEGERNRIFPVSDAERYRLAAFAPATEMRWHYRGEAAELAWRATEWLPRNDDDAAAILAIAGSWLKGNYPKAAERFFQALVIRHGNTELGKQAAALGWFPSAGGVPFGRG